MNGLMQEAPLRLTPRVGAGGGLTPAPTAYPWGARKAAAPPRAAWRPPHPCPIGHASFFPRSADADRSKKQACPLGLLGVGSVVNGVNVC